MTIDHADLTTAIEGHLTTALGTGHVMAGPNPIPIGGPWARYYYAGRTDPPEGRQTFGNVMLAEKWNVEVFWPRQPEPTTWKALEAEIARVDGALRTAFRGDSTLNGEATDLTIEDSDTDSVRSTLQANPGIYRALALELLITDLEGEAIAP